MRLLTAMALPQTPYGRLGRWRKKANICYKECPMKIAITGFSNSGKTAIFNALTGQRLETAVYPSISGEPHLGVVAVPDERVDRLSVYSAPKRPLTPPWITSII